MSWMKTTTFANSWHRHKLKSSTQHLAIQNPVLVIMTVMEDAVLEEDVDNRVEDEVFLLNVVLLIVKKLHDALLSNQGTTRLQPLEQRHVFLLLHQLLQETQQVQLRPQQEVLHQEPL